MMEQKKCKAAGCNYRSDNYIPDGYCKQHRAHFELVVIHTTAIPHLKALLLDEKITKEHVGWYVECMYNQHRPLHGLVKKEFTVPKKILQDLVSLGYVNKL